MKQIVFKEVIMKPTTWAGLALFVGSLIVLIWHPIPFLTFGWELIGSFLAAIMMVIPGALIITFNLMKTLEAHNIVRLK